MSFQQKMYAAVLITYRNDFTFNTTAVHLTLVAIPFLTVGIPAAIVRHTGIFNPEKEKRLAAGPATPHQPNPCSGDMPCPPHP